VEVSSSGIKAVKLVLKGAAENDFVLQACWLTEHRRLLNQSANDSDRNTLLDETLQVFLKQPQTRDDVVVLGLSDWMVMLKAIELPPMPRAKREAAIAHEARHLFPIPLSDLAWKDAMFEGAEAADAEKRPLPLVYAGLRRSLLKENLARWQKMGLRVSERKNCADYRLRRRVCRT